MEAKKITTIFESNYLSDLDKALGNLQMSLQSLETSIGEVRAMMRANELTR